VEKQDLFIITNNKSMLQLIEMAKEVAATKANILLLGESGTGKELFARLVHNCSQRKNKKIVAINCAALQETLLESELFGFEKGSFTGSIATKQGKFEMASGSTLLLDEISEMESHMQAKLLRAIQESEIDRIGSIRSIPLDLRIVSTSNKDLFREVQDGHFRADLYYRLNVIELKIPPLRDRLEDIEELVKYFIQEFNTVHGKFIEHVPNEVSRKLQNYNYPGNVRELKNIIERAVLFSKGSVLSLEYINFDNKDFSGEIYKLNDYEREHIGKVLNSVSGNRTKAAEKLGIFVRTLRNKIHKYKEEGLFV
jgi:transcriptional regulator with PAS, ATPase and Fis domain